MENGTTSLIILKELAGHAPTSLDPLQRFIMAHYGIFHSFWVSAWFITAAVLLIKLGYEYRQQKRAHHHGN